MAGNILLNVQVLFFKQFHFAVKSPGWKWIALLLGIDIPFRSLLCSTFPMSILLPIASVLLIFLSAFLILIILAQKAKSDGGMGAAMGGGMAEAAFGAETGNVLTKATINSAVAFFVLTFLLYLGQVHQHKKAGSPVGGSLPSISVPAAPTMPSPEPMTSVPPMLAPTAPVAAEPAPSSVGPTGAMPAQPTPSATNSAPTGQTSTAPAPVEQPKKP